MTRRLIGYAALLVLPLRAAVLAQPWTLEEPFFSTGGRRVQTLVVTIDPKTTLMRIVSVPFELQRAQQPMEASLRTFAQVLATDPRYRRKEWIAVNGGFSSYRVDVPLGLLVVDGKVYSTLSKERAKPGTNSTAPAFAQLRWSGVLCELKEAKTWDIISATQYRPDQCRQALQAGPVPVAPNGVVAIASNEPRNLASYARSLVCLTNDSKIRFILVAEKTHLLPLAQWMSKPAAAGGLGCRSALNLSGDTSAGMAIRSRPTGPLKFFGEGSFPIPSAIVIQRK